MFKAGSCVVISQFAFTVTNLLNLFDGLTVRHNQQSRWAEPQNKTQVVIYCLSIRLEMCDLQRLIDPVIL